jgi:hypothetical protein
MTTQKKTTTKQPTRPATTPPKPVVTSPGGVPKSTVAAPPDVPQYASIGGVAPVDPQAGTSLGDAVRELDATLQVTISLVGYLQSRLQDAGLLLNCETESLPDICTGDDPQMTSPFASALLHRASTLNCINQQATSLLGRLSF